MTGENIAADRTQLVSIGTLAVAILDWTASQNLGNGPAFQLPGLSVSPPAGRPSAVSRSRAPSSPAGALSGSCSSC